MEQGYSCCVCRINPLLATQTECGCNCHHNGETPAENEWRNPKRRRLDVPNLQVPHAVTSMVPYNAATLPGYLQMGNYANNNFSRTPWIQVSCDQSTSQNYLAVNGIYTPQTGLGRSRGGEPASTTCVATSHTLSPRSLETSLSEDQRRSTSPGQELGAENSLAGLNNFDSDFNLNRLPSWNGSNSNLLLFGNTDLWSASSINAASSTRYASASSFVAETQQNEDSISLTQASPTRLTEPSDDPWSYHPSFTDGNRNILGGEASKSKGPAPRNSTALTPHSTGLKVLKPSTNEALGSFRYRWSYTFADSESLKYQRPEKKLPGRPGCRNGPLRADRKKHASKVREIGACYSCQFRKQKCSLSGIPCDRCINLRPSLSCTRVCIRKRLGDYTRDLSPDLVFKRLRRDAIDLLIKENSKGFTENGIEIELLSGPDYPPIRLVAYEFLPKNGEFLSLKYVGTTTDAGEKCHKFTESFAPPLGLNGDCSADLRKKCISHIKLIIDRERDIGEATRGDTSMLSWEVFEAINRYRRSSYKKKKSLLRDAVVLHATYYFMSRIIIFTKASAVEAVSRLRGPTTRNYLPVVTSQLINLQVKQAMHGWLCDMTAKVLEGLDAALAPMLQRTKAAWADHFCTVLILCICIEAVQVASDGHVMAALRKDPVSPLNRVTTCRELDEGAYTHFTDLFHTFYKTQKKVNPIRDGLKANESDGITQQMEDLVLEIKDIMKRHDEDIIQRARNPSFDSVPDLLTHHMAFRKRNSGRLLAKFLLSFKGST